MRSIIRLPAQFRFPLLALSAFLAAAAVRPADTVMAGRVLADGELYESARAASARKDYFQAALLIYAYLQRNTDTLLKNAESQQGVWDFYDAAVTHLERALNPDSGVRYGMSAGVPALPPRVEAPQAPTSPQPRTPAGYPLVCRGGGALLFFFQSYSSLSDGPVVSVRFERSASGAGANLENVAGLRAGQCAWLDRGVGPGEPDTLVFAAPVFEARRFAIGWSYGRPPAITSDLPYLNALESPDRTWTFRAYNDGRGSLVVNSVN